MVRRKEARKTAMGTDSYRVTAKYYDAAYAAKHDLVDLPFYLELAREQGGPVLEIACGSGRVLLPVAQAGVEIHGVDNSEPMLRILEARLAKEPPEVRRRVTLHSGDMRAFRLRRKYPLVTIPFRPLQHMQTLEDQTKALTTAAFHLGKRGILALDVFYPKHDAISAGVGEEVPEMEWPDPSHSGRVVRRYFRKEGFDKIHQVFQFTFIFRTYEGEKVVLEEAEQLSLAYYTYPHLQALFRLAGLQPVAEYGSFAKTPLDNAAQEMIFLLCKAD